MYLPVLISRLGFQSAFPRAVVFAPKHIGGIGITPFNTIILQSKLQFLHRHLRQKTELGQAILIKLKWATIQAGRRRPIFTSYYRIDYIENEWVLHLHKSLQQTTGKLLIEGINSGLLYRENDNT